MGKFDPDNILGSGVSTAETAAAAFAYGYAEERLQPPTNAAPPSSGLTTLLTGLGLEGVAIAGEHLGKAVDVMPHVGSAGKAGIGAYFHRLGAVSGAAPSTQMEYRVVPAARPKTLAPQVNGEEGATKKWMTQRTVVGIGFFGLLGALIYLGTRRD
jgi:hypothetical protein